MTWLRRRRLMLSAITAGLVGRVAFWVYTGRTWEDALIALTHVRNAVAGIGLTSHPGEGHIEGFSSPIGVLVPLAAEVVVRGSGLNALRFASLAAFVVGALAAGAICRHLGLGTWTTGFVLFYLALDFLQVFYGMSGMETQFAVAILLVGTIAVLQGRTRTTGIAMGLALLARPELLLWIGAAAIATWRRGTRRGATAVALAIAVTAPWFLFAWVYYGNPIPLSVRAKSTSYIDISGLLPGYFHPLNWLRAHVSYHLPMWRLITPFRDDTLVLAAPVPEPILIGLAIGLVALALAGAWRTRHVPGWGPAIFLCGAFMAYRVALLPEGYFDWYWPPVLALFMINVGAGLETIHGALSRRPSAPGFLRLVVPATATTLAVLFAVPLVYRLPLDRRIQAEIDDGVRRPVGIYLGRVVPPNQAVVTEAAGYIGYYSNVRLVDYPGLTSPAAVNALKQAPPFQRDLPFLVSRSQPEWLAVRPSDVESLRREYPEALAMYRPVRRFSTTAETGQWGLTLASLDREFIVMRRVG